MEFMGYHIVDVVIVGLIAFLAIKGLVNGFIKELLNLIIIVAGVALAARYNTTVIQYINEQDLIPQIADKFAPFAGFVLIILSVWLIMGLISSIITKMTSESTGFLSRLLGYILSATRYIFIFSLLIFGMNKADYFKKYTEKFNEEAQLFKPMAEIGSQILNIDINNTKTTESNTTNSNEISHLENNLSKQSETTIESNSSY